MRGTAKFAAVLAICLLVVGAYEGSSLWDNWQREAAIKRVAVMMDKCGWGYDLRRAESYVVQAHLLMRLAWTDAGDLFRASTSCGAQSR
jgi:hypothetical protein